MSDKRIFVDTSVILYSLDSREAVTRASDGMAELSLAGVVVTLIDPFRQDPP
jgi:hypothetical protein